MPLRVIFRRAIEDGDLAVNRTGHLRLPAVRGRRERIGSREEAQVLLAALPERDRAVWATALYAGLRHSELMALRWENVDLAKGLIHVERAYDEKGRVHIEPKSRAGRRTIPIIGTPRRAPRTQVTPGPRRGPRLRRERGHAVRGLEPLAPSPGRVAPRRPQPNRPPRGPPHVRVDADRRRRQRESDYDVHGACLDPDHRTTSTASSCRLRSGGGCTRRRVSHARLYRGTSRSSRGSRVTVDVSHCVTRQ